MADELMKAHIPDNMMPYYHRSDDVVDDMQGIIDVAQSRAHQLVNLALVQRNWLLGYRIAEEEMSGDGRAGYGLEVIKKLSKRLTAIYGKGYTKTNLYNFVTIHSLPGLSDRTVVLARKVLSDNPGRP